MIVSLYRRSLSSNSSFRVLPLLSSIFSSVIPLSSSVPVAAASSSVSRSIVSQLFQNPSVCDHRQKDTSPAKSSISNNRSCGHLATRESTMGSDKWLGKTDPSSFSNPEELRTESIHLKWTVDFSLKVITGSTTLNLAVLNPDAKELILDTRDIKVDNVTSIDGSNLSFTLGKTVSSFGEPLTIQIGDLAQVAGSGNKFKVTIHYTSSNKCTGLQWLDSIQTAGKRHPYVFSQCQAIHARSLMPCQDTPFVKATYTAEVSVPKELRALMSAVPVGEPETGGALKTYRFEQKTPIPSYLTAIAVGDLVGKQIGPRSHVWAEKEVLEAAAFEFADTEKMLLAAENLLGKYVWGQYDILVLPPSFPYGGMENPCLTFATPTLLAGDKSLANVIAHEIAHSWTGNLVTNKDWEHFWLNEGFTVFAERKILSALQGEQYRQFACIGGWTELKERVKEMKDDNPLTRLVVDLNGIDPDDAFSIIPYEKGSAFLYYLEQKVGGPSVFEPFLRDYIQTYSYKSIDSNVFKTKILNYFQEKGLGDKLSDVDWDRWFYTPGMPPVKNQYDQTLTEACRKLKNRWIEWDPTTPNPFQKSDLDSMLPDQIQQFLQNLLEEEALPLTKIQAMDKAYGMMSRKNSEIRFRWIRICIRARSKEIIPLAMQFVNEQGRMKFVRPIYRELYAWDEVRPQAIENYRENSKYMMHVLAKMLLQDLHIK